MCWSPLELVCFCVFWLFVPSWAVRSYLSDFLHPAYSVDQFAGFVVDGWIRQVAVVAVTLHRGLALVEQQAVVFLIRHLSLIKHPRQLPLTLGFGQDDRTGGGHVQRFHHSHHRDHDMLIRLPGGHRVYTIHLVTHDDGTGHGVIHLPEIHCPV